MSSASERRAAPVADRKNKNKNKNKKRRARRRGSGPGGEADTDTGPVPAPPWSALSEGRRRPRLDPERLEAGALAATWAPIPAHLSAEQYVDRIKEILCDVCDCAMPRAPVIGRVNR